MGCVIQGNKFIVHPLGLSAPRGRHRHVVWNNAAVKLVQSLKLNRIRITCCVTLNSSLEGRLSEKSCRKYTNTLIRFHGVNLRVHYCGFDLLLGEQNINSNTFVFFFE